MNKHWLDILLPAIVALAFFFLSWSWGRSIRRGQPMTPSMRKGLAYAFFFVLGMGYSMAVVALLHWPRYLWIVLTVSWTFLLLMIRLLRSRRGSGQQTPV
jgi:hypothetical protein